MGAPNIVRGGRQSGNVAAAELLGLGLLHILSSHYVPSSPLQAVFQLSADGTLGLADGVTGQSFAQRHGCPWRCSAFFGLLLVPRKIPVVAHALTAPGMARYLEVPHSFRVAGVAFHRRVQAGKDAAGRAAGLRRAQCRHRLAATRVLNDLS